MGDPSFDKPLLFFFTVGVVSLLLIFFAFGILDTEALRPKLPPVICAVLHSFLFASAPPHLTKWQANTDRTQLVD